MLAKEVENPKQTGLGAMDMTVRRNAYGRQIDSFIESVPAATELEQGKGPLEMVFIRAPKSRKSEPELRFSLYREETPYSFDKVGRWPLPSTPNSPMTPEFTLTSLGSYGTAVSDLCMCRLWSHGDREGR